MAIPDFANYGAPEKTAGVGSTNLERTPNLPDDFPAGQTMLLYVVGDGAAPTLQTANGWVLGEDSFGNLARSAIAGENAIAIYWARSTDTRTGGGATTFLAPVLSDPDDDGNTEIAFHVNSYTDVRSTGSPFHRITPAQVTSVSASIAPPEITTTLNDSMIGGMAGSSFDDSLFAGWSGSGVSGAGIDNGFNSSACSWVGGRGGKATAGAGSLSSTFATPTQQAQLGFAIASLDEVDQNSLPPPAVAAAIAITPALESTTELDAAPAIAIAGAATPTLTAGGASSLPDLALATAAAVTPTLTSTASSLPAAAPATASAVTPVLVPGDALSLPAPAVATAVAVTPTLRPADTGIAVYAAAVVDFDLGAELFDTADLAAEVYEMPYAISQGDIGEPLKIRLTRNGVAFVIGAADVCTLHWIKPSGAVVDVALEVVSLSGGTVQRVWVDGDTDEPGTHYGQVDVLRDGETIPRTFPSRGPLVSWSVTRRIGA